MGAGRAGASALDGTAPDGTALDGSGPDAGSVRSGAAAGRTRFAGVPEPGIGRSSKSVSIALTLGRGARCGGARTGPRNQVQE
ncbi:hypothetical protein GCM10009547_14830 [Sporichthya brevicatena]|uniref:Uncharacterized protein n=1 Tax=Sporichthya brevicatena TaxID=171442 RepID=A0ABN1GLF9_9ACTN